MTKISDIPQLEASVEEKERKYVRDWTEVALNPFPVDSCMETV
jgi:hypothetical protein